MRLTGSHAPQPVRVSERQARELGFFARHLTGHHAAGLEIFDHGDEAWGVAGVLRALDTGQS